MTEPLPYDPPPIDHQTTESDLDVEEILTMLTSRTMLLSTVAEHLYWAGRHLERVEATARLVRTHTELYVDLPKAVGLGWDPLLAVTGTRESFGDAHDEVTEDDVVAFLLADAEHASSVVASLRQARENLRVTRGLIPRQLWEIVNEGQRWVQHTASAGCSRGQRLLWTAEVIRRCHTASGSETTLMSRDQAYAFLAIGRLLERADMTTRVLDVHAGITRAAGPDRLGPYADIVWMSTLRCLGGEQMYRGQMGGIISAPDAVRFLLRDTAFPRSVEHCLIEISRWLLELPHQEDPMAASVEVQHLLDAAEGDGEASPIDSEELHDYVDRLQLGLCGLHDRLVSTYFLSPELANVWS